MQELTGWRRDNGWFDRRRAEQARGWFLAELRAGLLAQLDRPEARARMAQLGDAVAAGDLAPLSAAADMLSYLRGHEEP
ncbi:MAG: methylmalonyl Co-A mutase-associated GTPase MeaB, partial [Paracoccus sp. (in: a-proteobacteria)]|nr:methylmalonyl Co-A mutase-associated GTPase MeaB [Paracoccus sp. (in: a-proteobacteria)]